MSSSLILGRLVLSLAAWLKIKFICFSRRLLIRLGNKIH